VNRIISFYPIENRASLLQDVSSTLKAIVSQRLVRDGLVSQEEALANADSATNLLWLLNNGPDSKTAQVEAKPA
jgi:Tfp pilus assembly ATPase PilU